MSEKKDLLIEIGTEELPPKSLKRLAEAFSDEISRSLQANKLAFKSVRWLATPRRLALIIYELDIAQADEEQEKRGPSIDVAFDENGKPTKATEGFARSCGVAVEQLGRLETNKGSWLCFNTSIKGQATATLLPDMIETALAKLPIAKRMRWGNSDIEFVRPIKWVLLLLGNETISASIMGLTSGAVSYGHRFHHPDAIWIHSADSYIEQLRDAGKVIADYDERREIIVKAINHLANQQKGMVNLQEDLLDEVTSLVEWPVAFVGHFAENFLSLPKEVLIATMQDHQKYFPVLDGENNLMPCFIAISNIESNTPQFVQHGNERVIQPRLSDASFFFERDKKRGLESLIPKLSNVVYQKKLGTLFDRKERIKHHATYLAEVTSADINLVKRAADLCFCDLLSEMVFEFPELQGTMGKYYAEVAGEPEAVCNGLEEFYLPRFSGDVLPASDITQCLAIAEKIDSLLGIFAIGQAPTGTKDPFALRRAAIGLLRIIIEAKLDIDLSDLLSEAAKAFQDNIKANDAVEDVLIFLQERLRRYYLDEGMENDTIDAVLAVYDHKPMDFVSRLQAVTEFKQLAAAESLAAANKRIANILRKNGDAVAEEIDNELLKEEAEKNLAKLITQYRDMIIPLAESRSYTIALQKLSDLRESIDHFFDNVMVMSEDDALRKNRLVLLQNLHTLFIKIADISKLQA